MASPRVLVGQLWQESHSFNPLVTGAEDFAVERGAALVAANREAGSALGGILREGDGLGFDWVPAIAARARPGGPIADAVFEEVLEALLACGPVDAVCLELHGAVVSETRDDCEGDILAALRDRLGPGVPIAAALDLHAQVTPRMVEAADVLVAYKTNPHADMAETGAKAARLLAHVLAGERPARAFAPLPFICSGHDETDFPPLAALHALAAEAQDDPVVWDVSICTVHPFLDVLGLGQAILGTGTDSARLAEIARDLGQRHWAHRHRFRQTFTPMAEGLAQIRDGVDRRPWVVGDQGDRVLGGAPGDCVALPRLILEDFPELRAAVPVYDPEGVAACTAAGLGAVATLEVGGRVTSGQTPLSVSGRVRALSDGRFVHTGAYMTGVPVDLGPTAVLEVGHLNLLLTTRAPFVQDPAAFESQGLPLESLDLLVAKSGNHFKLGFRGRATPLVLDTPGLSRLVPEDFPFDRARPVWPLDEIALETVPVRLYGAGA